jgi:hypothetical protein
VKWAHGRMETADMALCSRPGCERRAYPDESGLCTPHRRGRRKGSQSALGAILGANTAGVVSAATGTPSGPSTPTGDDVRAAVLAGLSEKAFSQQVVNRAKALGWRVYRTWRSDHSPAGFPDLILCKPPRLLAVELKVKRNQLSEQQVAWLTDLALCRTVETLAAWPADYDALCKLLEAEESARPPGGRGGE